ncbi:hypothetical protein [Methylobacterium sp. JK268]
MTLDASSFAIHDVADFPLVRWRPEQVAPGYAAAWEREMEALVAHGAPFVILFAGGRAAEPHEDRVRRGLWLKRHKEALARHCRALITVEPDPEARLAFDAQAALTRRAFGIPMESAASADEAVDLARRRLQP